MELKYVALAVLALFLVACSGSESTKSTSQTGRINGLAFDSAISGGTVAFYTLSGELIVSSSIDGDGRFTQELDVSSQILRMVVSGGSYTEEFTGENISVLNRELAVYVNYVEDSDITIPVTLFTHIGAGLFEFYKNHSLTNQGALSKSTQEINEWLGFDAFNTLPFDVTKDNTHLATSNEAKYAFTTSAVSALAGGFLESNGIEKGAQSASNFTSIGFSQLAYLDVLADSDLDGDGAQGRLYFGTEPVDSNTYRHDLGLSLIKMALSENNESGIDANELIATAESLSKGQGAIFGYKAGDPLVMGSPIVSNLSIENNAPISGSVELTFNVTDVSALSSIEVAMDDNNPESILDIKNPLYVIDSTLYSEGSHTLTISAINIIGNSTEHTLSILVANESTQITNISPASAETIKGLYRFSATYADSVGIDSDTSSFYIDNEFVSNGVGTNGQIYLDFDTTDFEDGQHTLKIQLPNLSGYVAEASVAFSIDNYAPSVDWVVNNYLEGIEVIEPVITDVSDIVKSELYLDGEIVVTWVNQEPVYTHTGGVDNELLASGIHLSNFSFDTSAYDDGVYTLTLEVEDSIENTDTIIKEITIDNTLPLVEIRDSYDGRTYSEEFNLPIQMEDLSGFLNSALITYEGPSFFQTTVGVDYNYRLISPKSHKEGWYTITLEATDASGKTASDSVMIYFDSNKF